MKNSRKRIVSILIIAVLVLAIVAMAKFLYFSFQNPLQKDKGKVILTVPGKVQSQDDLDKVIKELDIVSPDWLKQDIADNENNTSKISQE